MTMSFQEEILRKVDETPLESNQSNRVNESEACKIKLGPSRPS